MIFILYGKGVTTLKLRLLLKLMMMLLLIFAGFHFVSIHHSSQPLHAGKVLAVEAEASLTAINLVEDNQKHYLHSNSNSVKDTLILVLMILSLIFFAKYKSKRKMRHFLYSVYYQSSYFSKRHLLPNY
jgi:TctA family transporter